MQRNSGWAHHNWHKTSLIAMPAAAWPPWSSGLQRENVILFRGACLLLRAPHRDSRRHLEPTRCAAAQQKQRRQQRLAPPPTSPQAAAAAAALADGPRVQDPQQGPPLQQQLELELRLDPFGTPPPPPRPPRPSFPTAAPSTAAGQAGADPRLVALTRQLIAAPSPDDIRAVLEQQPDIELILRRLLTYLDRQGAADVALDVFDVLKQMPRMAACTGATAAAAAAGAAAAAAAALL